MQNKIINGYQAVINGQKTALAGCDNDCLLSNKCLRHSNKLKCNGDFKCNKYPYNHFITT